MFPAESPARHVVVIHFAVDLNMSILIVCEATHYKPNGTNVAIRIDLVCNPLLHRLLIVVGWSRQADGSTLFPMCGSSIRAD